MGNFELPNIVNNQKKQKDKTNLLNPKKLDILVIIGFSYNSLHSPI